MDITRADRGGVEPGPDDWFAGEVEMEELAPARESGGVQLMKVHFAPGSRTAWHSHPAGQLLHVTAGFGLVQSVGGPAAGIGSGDTVWAGPGECHWHGATAEHALTHLAIQQPGTTWEEHVSDEDYAAAAATMSGE
jgi:quercetin dioxygenase-like cupin family protein